MRAKGSPEDLFGASGKGAIVHQSVHVGAIEQVDAAFEGDLDQSLGFGFVRLAAQAHPQRQPRNPQSG